MSEPELHHERVDDLRRALDLPADTPGAEPPAPATHAGPSARARVAQAAAPLRARLSPWKRRARLLLCGSDPRTIGRLSLQLDHDADALRADFEQLKAEVRSMAVWVGAEDPGHLAHHVAVLTTNLELVTAELRGVASRIDEVAGAIAPGAGLAGAAPRMAELRERVNAIDRRVRQISDAAAAATATTPQIDPPSNAPAVDGAATAPPASGGSGFDYVGFEQRFRGDPAVVLDIQRERYLEHLRGHQPVLDVGCGRGELLQMLAQNDIEATGVDLDAGMVAEAVASGMDAHHGDAIDFLRRQPEHSFGAIISTHVVEHLELDLLIELLELSATRLKPGGLFIAETPNPATLLVLGNSYILDPTHVWPLHPSLLTFLCERAGFRSVDLLFGAEAADYQMDLLPTEGATAEVAAVVNPALERLNQVLFGPQEYAVLARTPDV
ncbi:MAG: class I SAM-dependent methyltransferase [Acidimicrobiia bacterium]|nr:class I SAM-dependent methyltransferase [Acidimicrobiia bacterium]